MGSPSQCQALGAMVLGALISHAAGAQVPVNNGPGLVAREAESRRALRAAAAQRTESVSPYYSIVGGDTELYLLNVVADPLLVDAAAVTPDGERLPLGTFLVEPNRHLTLSLREQFATAERRFHEGSLWLSFLGDAETLQAWAVVKQGRSRLEIPFVSPQGQAARRLFSFWDVVGEARPPLTPRFYLVNTGIETLSYEVEMDGLAPSTGSLEPGERRTVVPASTTGFLTLSHNREPSSLILVGLLEGKGPVSRLPVFTPAQLEQGREYHAIRVPTGLTGGHLTIWNPGGKPSSIDVEAKDLFDGTTLATTGMTLGPNEVQSVPLTSVVTGGEPEKRLALFASEPVLVGGSAVLGDGTVEDLALFMRAKSHQSGSYPLPGLDGRSVFTTIVNVGEFEEEILAQVFWPRGTYALPPVHIPPGGAYRIEIGTVADARVPDLLGRELDPSYTEAFFRWMSRRKEPTLIARTEVRENGTEDSFGFSCFGCCWEMPDGIMIPGETEFLPGQTVPFQAGVLYYTCNSTLGPYYTLPHTLIYDAPFSWDGSQLSAAGIGFDDDMRFQSDEVELKVSCTTRLRNAGARGTGSACKVYLAKAGKPGKFWKTSQTCSAQLSHDHSPPEYCTACPECCDKIYYYARCRNRNNDIILGLRRTCYVSCATDHGCNLPIPPPPPDPAQ